MDWKSCIQRNVVKEVKEDNNLKEGLIKESQKKKETDKIIPLNDITASTKISIIYDVLRETLEAVAIVKGYKVYNHECYVYFLKEVLKESYWGDEFDQFSIIRNDLSYNGKNVTAAEAKLILEKMKALEEKITNKYLK